MKLEYACRVLAQLGRTFGTEQLAHIETLAKLEAIPSNYLVQILNDLRNSGLINSKRGKQGGYCLASPPDDVTLRDIIQAIDPEMIAAQVSAQGQSGEGVRAVWSGLSNTFEQAAQKATLRDCMTAGEPPMYHI
ncbi:MAG: RrF2 family transcriptional regulator [Opitutales bacterium]